MSIDNILECMVAQIDHIKVRLTMADLNSTTALLEINKILTEVIIKHQKYTRAWYGLSSFNEKFREHMNDPDEEATVLKYWRSRGTNPQYDEFIEAHGIDQEYIDLFKKVKMNAGAYDKEMDLESIIESIRDEINTDVLFKVYRTVSPH
jgi:hypothetical protein